MSSKPDSINRRREQAWTWGIIGAICAAVGIAGIGTPVAFVSLLGAVFGAVGIYQGAVAAIADGIKLGASEKSAAE